MNRVVNATVISNYASVARLDILRHAAAPLYMPVEVYDEVVAGRLAGYDFYDHIEDCIEPFAPDGWLHLIAMTDEELRLSITLPGSLHAGEPALASRASEVGAYLPMTIQRASRPENGKSRFQARSAFCYWRCKIECLRRTKATQSWAK